MTGRRLRGAGQTGPPRVGLRTDPHDRLPPEAPLSESNDAAAQLDALHRRYRSRFAGHPRVTRSVEELQGLIGELKTLMPQLSGDPATSAEQMLDNWNKEVEAIRAAQAEGPAAAELKSIEQWYTEVRNRYARRFAGKRRDNRDLSILAEIDLDLSWLLASLDGLPDEAPTAARSALRKDVSEMHALVQAEKGHILEARNRGLVGERAQRYASAANQLFARYRMLFAGEPRISRRPGTLEAICTALDEVRQAMAAMPDAPAPHQSNLELVKTNLSAFRGELDNLKKSAVQTTPAARVLALGDAANTIFRAYREEYGGKPRHEVDPTGIEVLWEKLWPVSRELADLHRQHGEAVPSLGKNLQLTRDMLRILAREYGSILDARKDATGGTSSSQPRA